MAKIEALAFIKLDERGNPKLAMVNKNYFIHELRQYPAGTKVNVYVEKWRDKRSLESNAYLHAIIGNIAKEVGHEPDTVKEFLKKKFLSVQAVSNDGRVLTDPETGEVAYTVLKTADMDSLQMSEFIDKIKLWALEFLGLDVDGR